MRIAVVANTSWYLHNFRMNLMRALVAAGHQVVAVAPRDGYSGQLRTSGIEYQPVVLSGQGMNPLVELRTVMQLHRVLRRQRIDLVLSYTPKGNLYTAMAAIPLGIGFVPNVSGLGWAFVRRSALTRLVELLYRLTFARAQRVFFQNDDDMQAFLEKGLVRAEKAERLPGSGVDLMRFRPCDAPVRPPDAPVFLLVARMLWDKGVGEYVQAAKALRERHPQARFQLLGPTGVTNPAAVPQDTIAGWVAEGCVEYLGETDDVRGYIEQADCVVLPSYREGVPRVVLEAAAMGRPVITTDAPGCRDTVIDGKTGFICKVADAADLADRFERFVALSAPKRRAMGLAGRALMERRFDERLVIARYCALVRALPNGSVPERVESDQTAEAASAEPR